MNTRAAGRSGQPAVARCLAPESRGSRAQRRLQPAAGGAGRLDPDTRALPGPDTVRCVRASAAGAATGGRGLRAADPLRSEEHTSELQSQSNLVCRLLLEKKK